jgi:hypothetical protein
MRNAFRAGLPLQGLKPNSLSFRTITSGTTEVVP